MVNENLLRFLETYAKDPMPIMKNEVQLNVTIDRELASTHRTASKLVDVTIEKMAEAALRFFYGSVDAEVVGLRKRALAAAQLMRREKKALKMVRGAGNDPATLTVSTWGNLSNSFA